MKKLLPVLSVLLMALSFSACKKEIVPNQETKQPDSGLVPIGNEGSCPTTTVNLMAGQTINAGSITVTNDADFIYVTYTTANGYVLTQTHLYVGDCAGIPVNNPGNPIPGQFPYSSPHSNITTYTYQVPISAIPAGGCGCIAAHCVVVKLNASGQVIETQTGWGSGTQINLGSGNWGMKFSYCSCSQ
ncbi:MAG: hypothetical protein JST86_15180 [Bacteroidetes bacterium]|nr:hypothetical protein [Bacteroidota bacterium]